MSVHNRLDEISGESIHAALIEKRSSMLSRLSLRTDRVAEADLAGAADRPQVLQDDSVALRQNRLEYEMFQMIEDALDRLNAGNFGSCLACGRTINLLRLQAIPWAPYCVICQNHVTSMGQEAVARQNREVTQSQCAVSSI